MKEKKNEIESYVTFPRYILSDLRNGKLTYREYELFVLIRLQTNPYGISTVNIPAILDDMPHFKSTNNVTKHLKSLLRKKYIYYPRRQGRRGSFEVRQDNWLLPSRGIAHLDKYFGKDFVRGGEHSELMNGFEVEEKLQDTSPMSESANSDEKPTLHQPSLTSEVRSSYNDTNNDTDTDNDSYGTFKGTLVSDFIPTNGDERRCKEIALELKEKYINSLLGILRKREGAWLIEKAWEVYSEDLRKGKRITNDGAYFVGISKRIASKKPRVDTPMEDKYGHL